MNTTSVARLALVYPVLADKVYQMETILGQEGITIICAQGIRTWSEQAALYAQGRTAAGKIVTNAAGGHSWHNFGCAVDCDPVEKDNTIDWNPDHPQWKRMEAVGVSVGLVSGANWIHLVDAPHFQLTGRFPMNAPDDEVRQLFTDGGMQAVWDEITTS